MSNLTSGPPLVVDTQSTLRSIDRFINLLLMQRSNLQSICCIITSDQSDGAFGTNNVITESKKKSKPNPNLLDQFGHDNGVDQLGNSHC